MTPTASATDLRVQAIYFEKTHNADQRDLAVGSLAAISSWKAGLWTDFLASWDLANKGLKIHTTTPKGLPDEGPRLRRARLVPDQVRPHHDQDVTGG